MMRFPRTRQIPGAPPVLGLFTAYTLGAVALVVWVARSDSPWVLVLSVAVVWALAGTLLAALWRLLGGAEPALGGGRRLRRREFVLVTLPALIAPLIGVAVVRAQSTAPDAPAATVRAFLGAAVVDGDGETACSYLTPQVVAEFEGPAQVRATCESFFGGATLDLGGPVTSDAQVDALHYAVAAHGSERVVTVSRAGHAMRFVLRPATPAELNEFLAPPTGWRITSSVDALGPSGAAPGV